MTLAAATLAVAPGAAAEQPAAPQRARADVAGTIGWLSGNKSDLSGRWSNDWYNRGLFGGATAGWYWTEHHKTEIEFGASSAASFWTAQEFSSSSGFPAYGSSYYTFSTRRVAVGQQYQFLHNAWVHPHVGAGLDLTWERVTERDDPVFASGPYDPVNNQPRVIRNARVVPPHIDLRARPFAEAGFKAYVSPRAFFRGDLRVIGLRRVDEVILRCGFGIDF